MQSRTHHQTYNSSDDILTRLIDKSQWIAKYLRAVQSNTSDQRRYLLLENLIKLQNGLSRNLEAYRKIAPRRVLDTYSQYSPDLRPTLSLRVPNNVDDIIGKTLELNDEISAEVHYLADQERGQEEHRAYQNLNDLVDSTLRDISMSGQTIRDM